MSTDKYRNRLITLLKELFQLDQPELDFGLYKIMHAKSVQISQFLENDLLKEIEQAFGKADGDRVAQAKAAYDAALEQAKKFGAPDPENTDGVKEAKAAYENAKDGGNAETEIYDHLYRFFERYYENGDFMSRRYYARESDNRAAPYAVPYDGREVYLHWANKDQYYIKSSEYLTNYTFELNEAIRQEAERQKQGQSKTVAFDFDDLNSATPRKVHLRIVGASEGEHGNIKAGNDQRRFFIIHAEEPVKLENGELVIQFQYRNDAEKSGQDKKWQQTRLDQAQESIVAALQAFPEAASFAQPLQLPAPTDAERTRTLLGKHLQKYSNRNTMDYFIHKDLGSFLHRELDFYIKNEIMRLDDIVNAEAPKVEQYLAKIKVLRRIAHQLIAFLAQLENFQKKLWLKKKFVTETQYCITLDRIPEHFYSEIAANDRQREEWVRLIAIDKIKGDLATQAYSVPLTIDFLKSNPFLLIDTAFFPGDFKERLLSTLQNLDTNSCGHLLHSENFHALGLLQEKFEKKVSAVYIDPPYNTSASEIIYKNSYKSSSWLSLIENRVNRSLSLLHSKSIHCFAIDDFEGAKAQILLNQIFSPENELGVVAIKNNPSGRSTAKGFSISHEYSIFHGASEEAAIGRLKHSKEQAARYKETDEKGTFEWVNFRKHGGANANRYARQKLFYPIFVEGTNKVIFPDLEWNEKSKEWIVVSEINPAWEAVYPITPEGDEKTWKWGIDSAKTEYLEFCVRKDQAGRTGIYKKARINSEGTLPLTVWDKKEYSSTEYGTNLLKRIYGKSEIFSFPKSLFAVMDALRVSNFLSGYVLDYFGGSGTTAHACMELNREDKGERHFILTEMGAHFDNALLPRIKKITYSSDWKDGFPTNRDLGISQYFKYIRLESYEDALNNLVIEENKNRDRSLTKYPDLQRDYLLNYFLDVETDGSQSLLNIEDFRDPTAYKMWIKKPGSDEQVLQTIDLIETFNWLLGLWVDHLAAPQSFSAEFDREVDPDLPGDQNTRLICKRLRVEASGEYWFRLVEGYTLRVPGDDSTKIPTLIIWRKLTDDAEKDNAALQKYLETIGVSTREKTYEVIYVNGSHTLPNPVVEGEQTKVRLTEEAFHKAMWAEE